MQKTVRVETIFASIALPRAIFIAATLFGCEAQRELGLVDDQAGPASSTPEGAPSKAEPDDLQARMAITVESRLGENLLILQYDAMYVGALVLQHGCDCELPTAASGASACRSNLCTAQGNLCAAHALLDIASTRAEPYVLTGSGGTTWTIRPQPAEANASLRMQAAKLAAAAGAASLLQINDAAVEDEFGCPWTDEQQTQYLVPHLSLILSAWEVYDEAILGAVESSLAVADKRLGEDVSLGRAAGESWSAPVLSRSSAAHLLVGGDPGLAGSLTDALCDAEKPTPAVETAIRVLRDSAISPVHIKNAALDIEDLLHSTTLSTGSVRARLQELYPSNASELASKDLWDIYHIERNDFLVARDYLRDELISFRRSNTQVVPPRILADGSATMLPRYAAVANRPSELLDVQHAAVAKHTALEPSVWLSHMEHVGLSEMAVNAIGAFETFDSMLDDAYAIYNRDTVAGVFLDNVMTTSTVAYAAGVRSRVGAARAALRRRLKEEGLEQVLFGVSTSSTGGYVATIDLPDNVRVMRGDDGVSCAVRGSIEGVPCTPEQLEALTLYKHMPVQTIDCVAAPGTRACRNNSQIDIEHWEGNYIYFVSPKTTVQNPGDFEALAGGNVGDVTSSTGSWEARWYIFPDNARRVAEIMEPSVDWCSQPRISCAGETFDARIPLENELSSDGDDIESSWRHYLALARQAADEADLLGEQSIQTGLDIAQREESEILRLISRSEEATQKLQEICGTDVDLTSVLSGLINEDGEVELDASFDPIQHVLSSGADDASLSRLRECIDEGNVLDFVAVGDSHLCLWRDAENENVLCPGSNAKFPCPVPARLLGCGAPWFGQYMPEAPSGHEYEWQRTDEKLDYFTTASGLKSTISTASCPSLRAMRELGDQQGFEGLVQSGLFHPDGGLRDIAPELGWEARYGGYSAITLYGQPIYSTGSTQEGAESEGWPCDIETVPDDCDRYGDSPESLFCYPAVLQAEYGADYCSNVTARTLLNEAMLRAVVAVRITVPMQPQDRFGQLQFSEPAGGSGAIKLPFYVASSGVSTGLNDSHSIHTGAQYIAAPSESHRLEVMDGMALSEHLVHVERTIDYPDEDVGGAIGDVYSVGDEVPESDFARRAWYYYSGFGGLITKSVEDTESDYFLGEVPVRFAIGSIHRFSAEDRFNQSDRDEILLRDPYEWYAGLNSDDRYPLPGAPTTVFDSSTRPSSPYGWLQLALAGATRYPATHRFDLPLRYLVYSSLEDDIEQVAVEYAEGLQMPYSRDNFLPELYTLMPFVAPILPAFSATPKNMMSGLELLCEVGDSADQHDCDGPPPEVESIDDLGRARAHLYCTADKLQESASRFVLARMPAQAVDALRKKSSIGAVPLVGGAYAQSISVLQDSLQDLARIAPQIGDHLRLLGDDLDFVRRKARELHMMERFKQNQGAIQLAAQVASQTASCTQATANAVGSIGLNAATFTGAAAFGAVAACANAASQIEMATDLQAEISRELAAQTEAGVADQLNGFMERFQMRATALREAGADILGAVTAIDRELAGLESLRRSARAQIHRALIQDSALLERQREINAVLHQRFNTVQLRYTDARRNAVRMAFLARRAIEQRLGVKLEELQEGLPFVEAPALWANSVCTSEGIDYAGLAEGSEQGNYADAFVGDYVTKLEYLIESYRAEYNFHEGDDMAVVSVRDDIKGVRATCDRPSSNLLYHAGQLDVREDDAGRGWKAVGCGTEQVPDGGVVELNDCVSTTALIESFVDGPFSNASPDAASARGYEVAFGPFRDAASGGGCSVPPCDFSESGFQDGVELTQDVEVVAGEYRLSWYGAYALPIPEQIPDIAASPEDVVQVGFVGTSGGEIETSDVLDVAGTNAWDRYYMVIVVPESGTLTVAIRPPRYDLPQGVRLAAMMLEALGPGEARGVAEPNPPEPFANTGEELTSPAQVCEDTDGSIFRLTEWKRGCTYVCNSGFGDACDGGNDGTQRCYRETSFTIDQQSLQNGQLLALAGFARGNYNYRVNTLGLNFVGTGIVDCESSVTPSTCFSSAFVPYSVYHVGPYAVRNHFGHDSRVELFSGRIEQARGLAAERYLTNPLSSADRELMASYERRELRGRPLDGTFVIRIWEQPNVNFEALEDVQLVLGYRYWTRFD